MWDNVLLLRNLTRALMFVSASLVVYGAAHYVTHLPHLLPIKSVRLNSVPNRIVSENVKALVQREVKGNFFTVDIDGLRLALKKLPWVRNVSIRREFPNTLVLTFEEHQPLARWNSVALVNQQGEVFSAQTEQILPRFIGYEGSAPKVTQQYAKYSDLLAVLHLQIKQMALSPRQAWRLQLSNNMIVELGHDETQQRLARFITVYPYSLGITPEPKKGSESVQEGSLQVVDMRYSNGFAVRKRNGNV